MAHRLDRHLQIVRHVADLLDTESSSSHVKRVLRTYLNRLEDQAPRRGRGAATGHFIDHVIGVSNRYWPGLFHTYEHPQIPATTSSLEGFFGSSKRQARLTTGRKSTAGGRLESCAEVVVRLQALQQALPPEALGQSLAAVSPQTYSQTKKRLRALREPARERRSIQRNLPAYLKRVLDDWNDSS